MTARIILAAILATVAMYIWMTLAHISPLGMFGISKYPDEAGVLSALTVAAAEHSGLYAVPVAGMGATGPVMGSSALIAYSYQGTFGVAPTQIVAEFVIELVQILILAFLICAAKVERFGCRFAFAASVGAIAAIALNGSYAIWYGFPVLYTCISMGIIFVGYLIAGLMLAWMLPNAAIDQPA